MTVRLKDDTERKLAELAKEYPSRAAAVTSAINEAYERLQERRLEAAYASVIAENPNYPYESSDEQAALRERRNRREARA
jgi:hypothetical protein